MEQKRKRLSILKKSVRYETASPTQTFTKTNRRISFSGTKSVKEFIAGEDKATIWGTSYEEEDRNHASSSASSTTSSLQNPAARIKTSVIPSNIPTDDNKENISYKTANDTMDLITNTVHTGNLTDNRTFNNTVDITLNKYEVKQLKFTKATHNENAIKGVRCLANESLLMNSMPLDSTEYHSKSIRCSFGTEDDRRMLLEHRIAQKARTSTSQFEYQLDNLTFESQLDKNEDLLPDISVTRAPEKSFVEMIEHKPTVFKSQEYINTDIMPLYSGNDHFKKGDLERKTILFSDGERILEKFDIDTHESGSNCLIRMTVNSNEDTSIQMTTDIVGKELVARVASERRKTIVFDAGEKIDETMIEEPISLPDQKRRPPVSGDDSIHVEDTIRTLQSISLKQKDDNANKQSIKEHGNLLSKTINEIGEDTKFSLQKDSNHKTNINVNDVDMEIEDLPLSPKVAKIILPKRITRQTELFEKDGALDASLKVSLSADQKRKTRLFGSEDIEIEAPLNVESLSMRKSVDIRQSTYQPSKARQTQLFEKCGDLDFSLNQSLSTQSAEFKRITNEDIEMQIDSAKDQFKISIPKSRQTQIFPSGENLDETLNAHSLFWADSESTADAQKYVCGVDAKKPNTTNISCFDSPPVQSTTENVCKVEILNQNFEKNTKVFNNSDIAIVNELNVTQSQPSAICKNDSKTSLRLFQRLQKNRSLASECENSANVIDIDISGISRLQVQTDFSDLSLEENLSMNKETNACDRGYSYQCNKRTTGDPSIIDSRNKRKRPTLIFEKGEELELAEDTGVYLECKEPSKTPKTIMEDLTEHHKPWGKSHSTRMRKTFIPHDEDLNIDQIDSNHSNQFPPANVGTNRKTKIFTDSELITEYQNGKVVAIDTESSTTSGVTLKANQNNREIVEMLSNKNYLETETNFVPPPPATIEQSHFELNLAPSEKLPKPLIEQKKQSRKTIVFHDGEEVDMSESICLETNQTIRNKSLRYCERSPNESTQEALTKISHKTQSILTENTRHLQSAKSTGCIPKDKRRTRLFCDEDIEIDDHLNSRSSTQALNMTRDTVIHTTPDKQRNAHKYQSQIIARDTISRKLENVIDDAEVTRKNSTKNPQTNFFHENMDETLNNVLAHMDESFPCVVDGKEQFQLHDSSVQFTTKSTVKQKYASDTPFVSDTIMAASKSQPMRGTFVIHKDDDHENTSHSKINSYEIGKPDIQVSESIQHNRHENFLVDKNTNSAQNITSATDINPQAFCKLTHDSSDLNRTAFGAIGRVESFQATNSSNSTATLCNIDPNKISGTGYKRSDATADDPAWKQFKTDYVELTISTPSVSPNFNESSEKSDFETDDIQHTHIDLVYSIDSSTESPEKNDVCEESVIILNAIKFDKQQTNTLKTIKLSEQQQQSLCHKCKNCRRSIFNDTLTDLNLEKDEIEMKLNLDELRMLRRKPSFSDLLNGYKERRTSICFNSTIEEAVIMFPTVPSIEFLIDNYGEGYAQKLREIRPLYVGASCPVIPPFDFLFKNKLKEISEWKFNELNLPIGVLECRHNGVRGLRLQLYFRPQDFYNPKILELYFQRVHLSKCSKFVKLSIFDQAVHNEIFSKLLPDLISYCNTSTQFFTFLDELSKLFEGSRVMVKNLLKITVANYGVVFCDDRNKCIIRKTAFNDNNRLPAYGRQIEFQIRVRNIEKLCADDILLPPPSYFKESVKILSPGFKFIRMFLTDPIEYLK